MKKLVVMTLALLMAAAGFAQKPQGEKVHLSREQIVEIQCSRLINELELDDATADRFTMLFKDYKNEIFAVKQKYHPKKEGKVENEEEEFARKTDAEVEKAILDRFAESREIIDIREAYYAKFKTILNPRQIEKIYRQEKKSQNGMRNEQMNRGGMPGPGGPGGPRPGGFRPDGQRPW